MSDNFGNYSNLNDLMSAIANKFKAKVGWTEAGRSVKKNLLQYDLAYLKAINLDGTWSDNVYTKNGITFTVNSDNSITVDGTASASATCALFTQASNSELRDVLLNKEITVNGMENFNNSNCYLYFYNFNGQGNSKAIHKGGLTFTFTNSSADFNMSIALEKDVSVSNLVVYPMIRLASILDDTYEPYILDNVELDEKKANQTDLLNEVKVRGALGAKNLLDNERTTYLGNGLTFTINEDKSITISGKATATTYFNFWTYPYQSYIPNGNYIISQVGCNSNVKVFINKYLNETWVSALVSSFYTESEKPFTVAYDNTYNKLQVGLVVTNGATVNTTVKVMIRLADDIDNTYQPYCKSNLQLTKDKLDESINNVLGAKNLLPVNVTTQTINGITFTVNADGSITANGTATPASAYLYLDSIASLPTIVDGEKYIFSGVTGGSDSTYDMGIENIISSLTDGEKNFTYGSSASIKRVYIRVYNGATVNDVTFKPMIRPASYKDDTYVPYAKTNKQLTDDVASVQASLPVKTSGVQALTGATTVTIQNANIHTTSFCTPFADNGSNTPTVWKTMTQTEGQVVLTFDALAADTTFYLTIIN